MEKSRVQAGQDAMLTIQQAQLAMNEVPAFKGNVKTIRTAVFVDRAAEDLYPGKEPGPMEPD